MKNPIKEKVKELLKQPYVRVLVAEADGGFSAMIPEFPGCFADGNNAVSAARNLERAAESWLYAMLSDGKEKMIKKPMVPETRDCKKLMAKIAGRHKAP